MSVGIRAKLLLIIISILIIVLGTNTYLQITLHKKAFDNELHQRTLLLKDNLHQRAFSQAETLRYLIAEYIAAYKFLELNNTAMQAAEDTKDLEKVVVLDKQKQVYVDTSNPHHSGIYIKDAGLETTIQKPEDSAHSDRYKVRRVKLKNSPALEFNFPIKIGQEEWGELLLVYSLSSLNNQITESTRDHKNQQDELVFRTLIITLSLIFFAYLVISKLSDRIIAPVITLTDYTKDIARGDFSQIQTMTSPRKDEIGTLTQNFVSMAKNIEESHQALANYNQTLEQKVQQRTYALNLNNSALKKAMSDLEESQQQLIHSEKMAALGQLIAGIAHEINTPLGAIQASAGNNSKSFRSFEKGLPNFLDNMSEHDKKFLCILLDESIKKIEAGIIYSTREERQLKRQFLSHLDKLEIENTNNLAELLLDLVNVEDLDELSRYLTTKNALAIAKLAHQLSALERNNQTILTAIGKASKVVYSLKNFSHHNITGDKTLSNINYGIQTVLVLYQNFLKQGCKVDENFAELPDILCYPDQLNQVWTNLIHNALYAMQNVGKLTIITKQENNSIIVSISDDGCGIPNDIQDKVFTSFFTTKPAGEGSGLGLGICKRIIDKHQGDISLVSRPGETTFTVTLPILES